MRDSRSGFRLYVFRQVFGSWGYTKRYGDWVVITGAANGIGHAMARELARRGHSIIGIDVDAKNLAKTKSLLESEPNVGRVETIPADLSDTSVENFTRIEQQLKLDIRAIGILFNCAGLAEKRISEYGRRELDAIRKTIGVNVTATALMTRLILPGMASRRKGLILNISSVTAGMKAPYLGIYGPTKAFVSEFSRVLELEYSRRHNVDVVYLTAAAVSTEMLTGFRGALPNWVMVSPDNFVKSVLNAMGTGIKCYSGHWWHGIWKTSVDVANFFDLLPIGYRLFMKSPRNHNAPTATATSKNV